MNSLGNKKIMADNIKKYMDINCYILACEPLYIYWAGE